MSDAAAASELPGQLYLWDPERAARRRRAGRQLPAPEIEAAEEEAAALLAATGAHIVRTRLAVEHERRRVLEEALAEAFALQEELLAEAEAEIQSWMDTARTEGRALGRAEAFAAAEGEALDAGEAILEEVDVLAAQLRAAAEVEVHELRREARRARTAALHEVDRERARLLQEARADAQQARAEARRLVEQARLDGAAIVADATAKAHQIRQDVERERESLLARVREEAQAQAASVVEQARREAQARRIEVLAELEPLRNEIDDLSALRAQLQEELAAPPTPASIAPPPALIGSGMRASEEAPPVPVTLLPVDEDGEVEPTAQHDEPERPVRRFLYWLFGRE